MSGLRKLQPKQKLSYNVLLSTIRLSYLFVLRARLYPISHVTMLASIPFGPRIPHSPLPNTQAMLLIGIYALPCIHCVKTAASVCKANCIDYHGHTAACSSLTRLTVFVPLTNSYACHVHTCNTSDQGVPLFLIIGHRHRDLPLYQGVVDSLDPLPLTNIILTTSTTCTRSSNTMKWYTAV